SVEGHSNTFNRSMNYNSDYWYELSIWDNATDLDYEVSANDTVDNWNFSSSSYSVTDNENPSMTDSSPDFGYTSEDFNFKVSAVDNIGVESVNVSWSHGSLSGNVSLSDTSDNDVWEATITLDKSTCDLTYRIQVNDTSDNHALSSVRSVAVLDSNKPLRIDNNSELSTAASSGSGTDTDPYIIEGLEIDGYGRGYGIYIGNTTDHFIVRDNELYNASGNSNQYFKNSGLYLYNVTNGGSEENIIYNNYGNGILLESSTDNAIKNNDVLENRYGICILDSSSDNLLKGNNATFNNNAGIYLETSKRNTIKDNNASDNRYYGIWIFSSNNNTIENNTIYRIGYYALYIDRSSNNILRGNNASGNNLGILLQYSDNNLVINNSAYENSYGIGFTDSESNIIQGNNFSLNDYGIYVYSSLENRFFENTISSNNNYGLYFRSGTSDNLIYHNDILNNSIQAADDGTDNQWYNATLNEGNYWSDYNGTDMDGDGVGETNYTKIDGIAGSNDTYPLTIPNNDNEEPSLDEDKSPENCTTGEEYTFNITATDDFEVGSVNVSWSHGSKSGNLALTYLGNDTWNGTITLDHSLDDLTYRVQVNDTSGNYVRGSEQSVSVSDNDDPSFTDNSEDTGTTGDTYTFDIDPEDNIQVDSVNVSWSHGALSANLALSVDGDGTWSGTITLDESLSDMNYRVQVNDTSDNYVRCSEQRVSISDNDDLTISDTTSSTPTTGEHFNVTATVSDNIGEDTVWLEYTLISIEGYNQTWNVSMNPDCWFEVSIWSNATDLDYVIAANDTSNNWNSVSNNLLVDDNSDPIANTGGDRTVDEDTLVTFDAGPSRDNFGIVSYTWTIEETEYDGEVVEYTFADPGDYTVKLNVTDDAGNYDTDTVEVTVNDVTAPEAVVKIGNSTPKTDEPINFNASDSTDNVGITDYEWHLENDKVRTGKNIAFAYDEPGEYTIELCVTDRAGNSDNETLLITVEEKFRTSDLRMEPTGALVGERVEFLINVTNTGDESDDHTVHFYLDGDKIGSVKVEVRSGETKTASLTYKIEKAGEYDLGAGGETSTVNVEKKETSTDILWPLLLILVISTIIAAIIMIRKKTHSPPKGKKGDLPVMKRRKRE
ncbi:MAG: NosD domain-containing protein, partial [Candidatus Saliniplasma sp.]